MDLLWTTSGGQARSLALPTDNGGFTTSTVQVTWTQVIGLGAGVVLTVATAAFLRYTKLGTAMRAMANDREITRPATCTRSASPPRTRSRCWPWC